jgi:hypothetical protein
MSISINNGGVLTPIAGVPATVINEIKAVIPDSASSSNQLVPESTVGDLTDLDTTAKTDVVSAINELVSDKADAATTIAGYGITDAYTKTEVDAISVRAYRPSGNATLATLPALTAGNLGKVYNMTSDFTTTVDFAEGSGIDVEAGNEVGIIDVGTEQSPSYKYTVLGGFVDLSGKQDVLVAGTNISIAADGKTISATDTTYESKTAVSGGTDVSLVTTGEKYTWNNAEPDSLTQSQITALLALLD